MFPKIYVDQKEITCMWVPRHLGILAAAKEAIAKESTDDFIPFSDLKPLTAKYIHQVWQNK